MKTLLVAILLGLILSTNVYAKKPEITAVWLGGEMVLDFCDDKGCTFACESPFHVSYYVSKDTALGLQLIIGDQDVISLGSWALPDYTRGTTTWYSGCFCIPAGQEWSMVWTLESTKNGRVIDAEEALSGICEP